MQEDDEAALEQSAEGKAPEEQLAVEQADMLGVLAARLLAIASADSNVDRAEVAAYCSQRGKHASSYRWMRRNEAMIMMAMILCGCITFCARTPKWKGLC